MTIAVWYSFNGDEEYTGQKYPALLKEIEDVFFVGARSWRLLLGGRA